MKQKRYRDQNNCENPENRVAPIHADVVIHGPNEQRERACEHGSQKHVGRDGAGAITRKSVDKVVEGCTKDCRETDTGEEDADNGRPVIYLGVRCPCA